MRPRVDSPYLSNRDLLKTPQVHALARKLALFVKPPALQITYGSCPHQ